MGPDPCSPPSSRSLAAQHSYWFSSISEKYLQAFTALLAGVR